MNLQRKRTHSMRLATLLGVAWFGGLATVSAHGQPVVNGPTPDAPIPCGCRGDINGDGTVDGLDIAGFARCLLGNPIPGDNCTCADIDGDGMNMDDISLFVQLDKLPCPPRGACCLDIDDGPLTFDTCVITDPISCVNNGGFFQGADSDCTVQACCLPSGFCQNADPQCCVASGGVPLGPNSNCALPPPCPPVGACCFDIDDGPLAFDTCEIRTQADCLIRGGVFQGAGTTCTVEACCLPSGFCQDADPECCIASGGIPQGPGSDCAVIPNCP